MDNVDTREENGQLYVTIDDGTPEAPKKHNYIIKKHGGLSAYALQKEVKKVLGPTNRNIQTFMAKALQKLTQAQLDEYDMLREREAQPQPEQWDEAQGKWAEQSIDFLLKIGAVSDADLMAFEDGAWEASDADAETELLVKLLANTAYLTPGPGGVAQNKSLNGRAALDAHFTPDNLHHADILRSKVVEYNNFLGSR